MKVFVKPLLLTGVLGIVFWAGFVYLGQRSSESNSHPPMLLLEKMEKEGIPAIVDKAWDGRAVDTAAFKGKLLIINYWASWCAPCVEEIPSLIKLVDEFKGDIQLIAISEDNALKEMEDFLKSFPQIKNKNIYVIYDETKKWMDMYKAERLPESFITDKDHKLVKKIVGKVEWHNQDSIQYFREMLKP